MKVQGSGALDLVDVMRIFEDKIELLEENLDTGLKERIAQDVEKTSAIEISMLMELFKNDQTYRKFLAVQLLEKLHAGQGQSLSGNDLVRIALNTFDLVDYRN